MKINKTIICIICALVMGITAYGVKNVVEYNDRISSDTPLSESVVSTEEMKMIVSDSMPEKVESHIDSLGMTVRTDSALAQKLETNGKYILDFVSKYDTSNLTYEQYRAIEAYVRFMLKHTPNDEEVAQINELIDFGATIQTVSDIYEFYLTTNDDFSIIFKIASQEEDCWGSHWIENVYNQITDNVHGVLDSDDIQKYIQTFTVDDIAYANILSRKGVYTIEEILKRKSDGNEWQTLNDEIYSKVLNSSPSYGSELERNNDVSGFLELQIDYEQSPLRAYNTARLVLQSSAEVKNEAVFSSETDIEQELGDKYSEAIDITMNSLFDELKIDKRAIRQKQDKTYESDKETALSSGLHESQIALFENKGYSMSEIANASTVYTGNPLDVLAELRKGRGYNQ